MAGQDDGGGHHRTSQGTTTDLINAGNKPVTLCLKPFFLDKRWYLVAICQSYPLYTPPTLCLKAAGLLFAR